MTKLDIEVLFKLDLLPSYLFLLLLLLLLLLFLLLLLLLLLQGPTMPTQQSNTGVKVAPLLNRPHLLPHRVTTPSYLLVCVTTIE